MKTIETDEIKSLKAIVSESKQDVSDAVNTRNVLREKLRLVIVWKSNFRWSLRIVDMGNSNFHCGWQGAEESRRYRSIAGRYSDSSTT